MNKGIIYIFTNDAMPDYIKIGITTDIKARLKELDTTAIPVPFRLHYAIRIKDYKTKERFIHEAFADHRVRKNREFFRLAPERAVAMLKAMEGEEISDFGNNMIDEKGLVVADRQLKNIVRKKNFSFQDYAIPVGAELVFTRDKAKRAHVLANNRVEYKGKKYSLSALAKKWLKEQGYNWKSVQGPAYFKYKNQFLTDMAEKKER